MDFMDLFYSSSSSSSSSSDTYTSTTSSSEEEMEGSERAKIKGYVTEIVPKYSNSEFQQHFRLSRAKVEVNTLFLYLQRFKCLCSNAIRNFKKLRNIVMVNLNYLHDVSVIGFNAGGWTTIYFHPKRSYFINGSNIINIMVVG